MDKHNIAISWLMVRISSFQEGLKEVVAQSQNPDMHMADETHFPTRIAAYQEKIAAVQESIEVLKRDAGIVSDAPAIHSGDVLTGVIVED